jgi:hypothetical protein
VAFVRCAALDGDVGGEIERQRAQRTETIGSSSAAASASSEADAALATDARTWATSSEIAASSRGLPSWWMGAAATPGSINSICRRSTTR